jgi:hypothetical protein
VPQAANVVLDYPTLDSGEGNGRAMRCTVGMCVCEHCGAPIFTRIQLPRSAGGLFGAAANEVMAEYDIAHSKSQSPMVSLHFARAVISDSTANIAGSRSSSTISWMHLGVAPCAAPRGSLKCKVPTTNYALREGRIAVCRSRLLGQWPRRWRRRTCLFAEHSPSLSSPSPRRGSLTGAHIPCLF